MQMKRRTFLAGTGALLGLSCGAPPKTPAESPLFSFIHCTDIHVHRGKGADMGFRMSIEAMNALEPDFVICGGDLVTDVLEADEARATELYDLYLDCKQSFTMPVHEVIGNHEVFGIRIPDSVSPSHPDWGKGLFKRRLGDGATYRSFDHGGVHFILLDSIGIIPREDAPGHDYIGEIGEEQFAWLETDLAALPADTPIIAAAHIPLFTLFMQINSGPMAPNSRGTVITDGKRLYDMLAARNLIGFLQGHIHINENYRYLGATFLDTGAICGAWWSGPRIGHPEGFNRVDVYPDRIENEYITYGWDASKYTQT
jgi:3',5'-cyclic-AMP phosphodiesterase